MEWLSVTAFAEWCGIPQSEVERAIDDGSLPVLRIGSTIRINREAVIRHTLSTVSGVGTPVSDTRASFPGVNTSGPLATLHELDEKVPQPMGFTWVGALRTTEPFEFGWPKKGGGKTYEPYTNAWTGRLSLHGHEMQVKGGETTRQGHGHMTVWLGPTVICEFSETQDGKWASLVRLWGADGRKKILHPNEKVPQLYRQSRLMPYRDVTGRRTSGVPNGLAVVIERQDRESAVYQAAARWLSWKRLELEPKL